MKMMALLEWGRILLSSIATKSVFEVSDQVNTNQPAQLQKLARGLIFFIIPPVYEVYRGYIVFAFSVRMFVCLSVCKLFFRQRFLRNYLT